MDVRISFQIKSYSVHKKSHRSIHFQLEHKCEECNMIICGKNNLNQNMKEVQTNTQKGGDIDNGIE